MLSNATQLVFRQTMQLIHVDPAFPNQVTQNQEKHGVFVLVPRVDLFPALGQVAFKSPQLVRLLDPLCHLLRFSDCRLQLALQGAIEGSTRNRLLFR